MEVVAVLHNNDKRLKVRMRRIAGGYTAGSYTAGSYTAGGAWWHASSAAHGAPRRGYTESPRIRSSRDRTQTGGCGATSEPRQRPGLGVKPSTHTRHTPRRRAQIARALTPASTR